MSHKVPRSYWKYPALQFMGKWYKTGAFLNISKICGNMFSWKDHQQEWVFLRVDNVRLLELLRQKLSKPRFHLQPSNLHSHLDFDKGKPSQQDQPQNINFPRFPKSSWVARFYQLLSIRNHCQRCRNSKYMFWQHLILKYVSSQT